MTCALAAQLGVAEALKSLLGVERRLRLSNEELVYSMVGHRVVRTPLVRGRCPCPHRRWRLVDCPQSPAELTLGDLVEQYERLRADDPAEAEETGLLQIRGEWPWISQTWCSRCGAEHPVRRFGKPGMDLSRRCSCGAALHAAPVGVRSVLPQADQQQCRGLRLHDLGLPLGGAVGMSYAEQWTYFFLGDGRAGLLDAAGGRLFSGHKEKLR
jgi:hypothetical protein